jgi:hypothetical protein
MGMKTYRFRKVAYHDEFTCMDGAKSGEYVPYSVARGLYDALEDAINIAEREGYDYELVQCWREVLAAADKE